MKTAIIISGNLRTFLMPTRESNIRLCDLFVQNILNQNSNVDIFIYTDTNDFYYNGTQYYAGSRNIEILNNNAFRISQKIDFIDNQSARNIISEQLNNILGKSLKSLVIEDPFNPTDDPKFEFLTQANMKGSSPTLLIHQFRKLKLAYQLINNYDHYDTVVKWRFDISYHGPLNFEKYDYTNNDVYVAGIHSPIIYDWHAFGKSKSMKHCLTLYDTLGKYLSEGKAFLNNDLETEITLAPEYHLYRIFKENNIKLCNSGYPACPYRYQDINTKDTVEEIVNSLKINASVISYTSGVENNIQNYEDK